jgi:LacI family transcriptional regulator
MANMNCNGTTTFHSVRTPFDQIATTAMDLMLRREPVDNPIRRALPTLIPRKSSSQPRVTAAKRE